MEPGKEVPDSKKERKVLQVGRIFDKELNNSVNFKLLERRM